MKAMVLTGIDQIEPVDRPTPVVQNPQDVLIRMTHVGVCGSDVHYLETGRIGEKVVEYPFAVGHEGAGVVEATGEKVTSTKKGDRIAFDPAMPCYTCDQCSVGRYHTCRNLRFLGCPGQAEGCLAEYIVMPQTSCFPLPANLTLEQGALAEPLSVGVYAATLAGDLKDKDIGILGSGPIGLSVLAAAKASGAGFACVTDKIDSRLRLSSRMGAELTANAETGNVSDALFREKHLGLDTVFECCGEQDALDQAVELLKPGGTLVIIGIPRADRISFNPSHMRQKEIRVQNVRRQLDCVQPALDLLSTSRLDLDPMVTHRFPFDRTADAFALVAGYSDGVVKAMVEFP